ncbi:MAG: Mth938-like domain-containing protein [Synechococcus sp.]
MNQTASSPRITHLSWGHLEIENGRSFKDAKLFPGGAREWNWTETGTRHIPGIQPADVEELLDRGATAVVLSKGMWKRLQVCPQTLEMLKSRGVSFHVHPTQEAVRIYNELQRSQPVGGLFHSTC